MRKHKYLRLALIYLASGVLLFWALAPIYWIVVSSILRAFPEEFAEHIELGRCPRPRRLPIPKLIDLADGRAVYDESFWRKQPDWTYAPDIGADDGTEHRS